MAPLQNCRPASVELTHDPGRPLDDDRELRASRRVHYRQCLCLGLVFCPEVPSWITDITAATPGFGLSLEKLGLGATKLVDSTAISSIASAALLGDNYMSAMEKLGLDSMKSLDKPFAGLDSVLSSGLDMGSLFKSDMVFEDSLAALGASVASSIDTNFMQDLIDQADMLKAEIEALDIDDRADELFNAHPGLTESIEHLPMLVSLSQENRNLVIWFVRIAVTLYVTCLILNVSMENADLAAIVGAVGLSGPTAGMTAGKGAKYLLDKIPTEGQQPDQD